MSAKDTKVRKSLQAKIATAKANLERAERDLSEYDRITAENSPDDSGVVSSMIVSPLQPTSQVTFRGAAGAHVTYTKPIGLTSAIRAIIENYPPGKCFTKDDVVGALQNKYPNVLIVGDAVSVQLWREARGDKMEISSKGNAHNPTIYKRRGDALAVAEDDFEEPPSLPDTTISQLHKQVGPTRANG